MTDYILTQFHFSPINDDEADLLSAFLAEQGYESFDYDSGVLNAYVQEPLYSDDGVAAALSSFPFSSHIIYNNVKIESEDWNRQWEQESFRPTTYGDLCVVHGPEHTDYPQRPYDITIEPRMAFGSGHHATTTMMIEALIDAEVEGRRVLDVGTGTGILAILAAKLGAAEVVAVEIDAGACENAVHNVDLNGLSSKVSVLLGDVTAVEPARGYDIVLANINRNVLIDNMPHYAKALRKGGALILSGFYADDVPLLRNCAAGNGFELKAEHSLDEWHQLIFNKI